MVTIECLELCSCDSFDINIGWNLGRNSIFDDYRDKDPAVVFESFEVFETIHWEQI